MISGSHHLAKLLIFVYVCVCVGGGAQTGEEQRQGGEGGWL